MFHLLIEAIVIGIITIIIGACVSKFTEKTPLHMPCSYNCDWNKYHIREVTLFITGALAHLIFEAMGANTAYCKNKLD